MKMSVVVPVYFDEEVIGELYQRLTIVLEKYFANYEIIFIDDGSEDYSWQKISKIHYTDSRVMGVRLIRNFGQLNSISAGLDLSTGDYIVVMDSDLQDRPEDIPVLYEALIKNNASMAIAKWVTRDDSFFKKKMSNLFYNVSQKTTQIKHEKGLGIFRIIKRSTLDKIKGFQEKTASTFAILYFLKSDYITVPLQRDSRFAGKSGYSLSKMLKMAFDRIYSFSTAPIKWAIYIGATISFLSFISGVFLMIRKIYGYTAPGWTSIVVIMLFFFGVNFLFLGILGEYISRIFLEVKNRPKYVIEEILT